jgi:hypothetical protein
MGRVLYRASLANAPDVERLGGAARLGLPRREVDRPPLAGLDARGARPVGLVDGRLVVRERKLIDVLLDVRRLELAVVLGVRILVSSSFTVGTRPLFAGKTVASQ